MALQNFIDKVTVATAVWLNQVDVLKETIFNAASTKSAARTALTLDNPLEILNGGTGVRTLPLLRASVGDGQVNALQLGLIPNDASKATANTTLLKALTDPATGIYTGTIWFPNVTGTDIYYLNDIVPLRDGLTLDLCGTTINFTKVGVSGDSQCGFFHMQRNCEIRNGSIVINYTAGAGGNNGNAIGLGGRGTDVSVFPPCYDSLLPSPMGGITLRNLNISVASAQARGIFSLGGLQGVVIDNVKINGNTTALNGVYAEFGWATNEASSYLRQTSHPNNWKVTNFECRNMTDIAYQMNGGYNISIDGIRGYTVKSIAVFGPGESMFFRPWSGQDGAGSKHNIHIKNAFGVVTDVGIGCTGIGVLAASYLDGPSHTNPNGLTVANLTDLLDVTIDNFAINGTANNYGIVSTAGKTTISHGNVSGFQHGIVLGQECTRYTIKDVDVLDSTDIGMVIGQVINTQYSPARQSTGKLIDVFVAGSGTGQTAGLKAALVVGTTISLGIENCRFGYEVIHDNKAEATQGIAISVNTDAFGVVVNGCYVAATTGGTNAYNLASAASSSRGCRLLNVSGVVTTNGFWLTDLVSASAAVLASAGTISLSGVRVARVTNSGAVTGAIMDAGTWNGDEKIVVNEGANLITYAAAGTSRVSDGTSSTIPATTSRRFVWDSSTSLWYPQK